MPSFRRRETNLSLVILPRERPITGVKHLTGQPPVEGLPNEKSIAGCLIGTAIGDALGLPYEGLSRTRQRKMFPHIDSHRFLFRWGMASDDTEHTCMVAQAIIASNQIPDLFARSLAWRFRFWLLGLPAGVGFATLRAIMKSWIGFPPSCSGVYSAGNGPAMRSAIIGVSCGGDPACLRAIVKASCLLTHTDPRALHGALAVALAARMSSQQTSGKIKPDEYLSALRTHLAADNADELLSLVERAAGSCMADETAEAFADSLHLAKGITQFVNHTVPVVIHVWLRHQEDYPGGVLEIIRCGGDTDTTAAIVGGIIGARVGINGIPVDWRSRFLEWPCSISWMKSVAKRLSISIETRTAQPPAPLFFPGILIRNFVFLVIVLLHGFRRLLPPY